VKSENTSNSTSRRDYNNITQQERQKLLDAVRGSENIYQELEMNYSLVQTHSDESGPGTAIQQHSHSFFETIYCVEGNIEYLLGTKRYQIHAGDIIIIPPGVVHCPIFPKEMTTPYRRYVVWTSSAFIKSIIRTFPETTFYESIPRVLRTAGTHWEYLEQFFSRGVKESTVKAKDWDICIYGNSIQLIAHLRRALYANPQDPAYHRSGDMLEEVLNYIQLHLHEKITLAATAKHFAVCESTIGLLFQKQMGVSFYRCVTQRRLAEAKNLIRSGASLAEIAVSVGFLDYSAFYRAFKQEFGISPRQFKKMQSNLDPLDTPESLV